MKNHLRKQILGAVMAVVLAASLGTAALAASERAPASGEMGQLPVQTETQHTELTVRDENAPAPGGFTAPDAQTAPSGEMGQPSDEMTAPEDGDLPALPDDLPALPDDLPTLPDDGAQMPQRPADDGEVPESEVEFFGEPGGEFSGDPNGEFSGEPSGEFFGEPGGELSGEPSGEFSGEPSGEFFGEPNGEFSGEPSGEFSGEPNGEFSGEPNGEFSGEPSGEFSGEPSGEFSGEPVEKRGGIAQLRQLLQDLIEKLQNLLGMDRRAAAPVQVSPRFEPVQQQSAPAERPDASGETELPTEEMADAA